MREEATKKRMDEVEAMLAEELAMGGRHRPGMASGREVVTETVEGGCFPAWSLPMPGGPGIPALSTDTTSDRNGSGDDIARRTAEIDAMIASELRTSSPLQVEQQGKGITKGLAGHRRDSKDSFGLQLPKPVAIGPLGKEQARVVNGQAALRLASATPNAAATDDADPKHLSTRVQVPVAHPLQVRSSEAVTDPLLTGKDGSAGLPAVWRAGIDRCHGLAPHPPPSRR